GRVNPVGLSADGKHLYYAVGIPNMAENKINSKYYQISIDGKKIKELESLEGLVIDKNISPDGKFKLSDETVKVNKVLGKDYYPEMEKSNVYINDGLDYRHWDTYNDGTFNHVFVTNLENNE